MAIDLDTAVVGPVLKDFLALLLQTMGVKVDTIVVHNFRAMLFGVDMPDDKLLLVADIVRRQGYTLSASTETFDTWLGHIAGLVYTDQNGTAK